MCYFDELFTRSLKIAKYLKCIDKMLKSDLLLQKYTNIKDVSYSLAAFL